MSRVLPWLHLGGRGDAKDLGWLLRSGVVTIINCTPPRSEDPAGVPHFYERTTPALRYHRVPLVDNASAAVGPALRAGVALLEGARHHGGVLVHCVQGVSRSAAVVGAYLIKAHGLTTDAALGALRSARPQARPNPAFVAALREYEREVAAGRAAGALLPPEPWPGAESGGGGGSGSAAVRLRGGESPPPAHPASRKRPRQTDVEGGGSSDGQGSLPAAALAGGAPATAAAGRKPPPMCEECGGRAAALRCASCAVDYCAACDAEAHAVADIGEHAGARQPLGGAGGASSARSGGSAAGGAAAAPLGGAGRGDGGGAAATGAPPGSHAAASTSVEATS